MKIKLILFSIIFFSISSIVMAQDSAPFLECHYAEKFRDNLLKKDKYRQDEMVLRVSKTSSEFFSLWRRTRDEIQDSILARGGSKEDVLAAREKNIYPLSNQHQIIFKNLPQKGMLTCTDKVFTNKYIYTEKLEKPQWNILKEKKIVANYSCQKAVTFYLGRKWIVWFTTAIPIPEGPWKLWGLPGLILEAADSENDYCFSCIEIKNITSHTAISVPKSRYIKCTKEQYVKIVTEYEEDTNKFMQKQGLSGVFAVGEEGKGTSAFPEIKYNYIEK